MSAVHRRLLGRIFNDRVKNAPTFGKKLYELLFSENDDSVIGLFRYLPVGLVSFLADTAVLMLVSRFTDRHRVYVSAGFAVGVTLNFILAKLAVFQSKRIHPAAEFAAVVAISAVGLALTNLLFSLFLRAFHSLNEAVGKLLFKILSAFIVLFRNCCARRDFYHLIDRRAIK